MRSSEESNVAPTEAASSAAALDENEHASSTSTCSVRKNESGAASISSSLSFHDNSNMNPPFSPLLSAYAPLRRLSIRSKMKHLQSICTEMDQQWKVEVSTYERGGSDGDAGDDRNYPNNDLRVVHTNLFPYHDALYPLLDVYYHLEDSMIPTDCDFSSAPSPVTDLVNRRQAQLGVLEADVPGFLPNSAYAVYMSLLPRYRAPRSVWDLEGPLSAGTINLDQHRTGFFDYLLEWENELWEEEEIVHNGTWVSKAFVDYMLLGKESGSTGGKPKDKFGPERMPTDKETRAKILTKIVRHALSDLQKDHRMGQTAMLLMAELRLFDDDVIDGTDINDTAAGGRGADRLSRLLAVVASEYVDKCDWRCHERYFDDLEGAQIPNGDDDDEHGGDLSPPNHYCNDWKNLVRTISTIISNGITFVTEGHAEMIAAFVLLEYDGISSAAAAVDAQYFESGLQGGSNKDATSSDSSTPNATALLKQNLLYHNNTSGFGGAASLANPTVGDVHGGHDVVESFRLSIVYALVDGLGWHAARDRAHLKKLVEVARSDGESNELKQLLRKTVDSYHNCVRSLASIGEHTIRRLPPNTRTSQLGGAIVRALVLASVDHNASKLTGTGYIGGAITNMSGKSLSSPTRFADAVTNAAVNLRKMAHDTPLPPPDAKIANFVQHLFDSAPHQDVQDVIKGLFLRDLVDVNVSGCGYGDYLVWCRLPITPLDPLLYDHCSHYPDLQHESGVVWEFDEEGKELSGGELAARVDFTILMLQRAWRAPWTPKSHRSFSKHQRDAIKTVTLCAFKYGMPNEIALKVSSFLPRAWWPDDRRQCFCHDCQLTELSTSLKNKVNTREAAEPDLQQQSNPPSASSKQTQVPATMHNVSLMRPLPAQPKEGPDPSIKLFECTCKVALYCSKEHRKYLMQDGHKRVCGTPPFRPHGIDEELLCREVFASSCGDNMHDHADEDSAEQDHDAEYGNSDDESCWESVGSDEEQEYIAPIRKTRTELIHKWFDSNAYKVQEVELPALVGAPP